MIVLDAAALVDVVLDQPPAGWVLDRIADEEVKAPRHQPAEVLSALARLVRADEIEPGQARDAVDEAAGLPQEIVPTTAAQLRQAFDLRERIRVLDGLYVALAADLDATLVTTDQALARSAPPCAVRAPALGGC